MLYDKKWDRKVETDPFNIDTLIAWLEKQPSFASYDFGSRSCCALAQYFQSYGYDSVTHGHIFRINDEANAIDLPLMPKGWDKMAGTHPHTFGNMLVRAKALKAIEAL